MSHFYMLKLTSLKNNTKLLFLIVDRDQGNKCFRVVNIPSETQGFRYEQALILCRSGPGFRPDLANIESIEENGEVIYLFIVFSGTKWKWNEN